MEKQELMRAVFELNSLGYLDSDAVIGITKKMLEVATPKVPVETQAVFRKAPKRRDNTKRHERMKMWEQVLDKVETDGLSVSKAIKLVTGRNSCSQYLLEIKELRKNRRRRAKSPEDGRVKRMKFIQPRAKQLSNSQGLSWEQALARASQEYSAKKRPSDPIEKPRKKYPTLIHNEDINKLLFDMLGRIIENKGSLVYERDGRVLGCNGHIEWANLLTVILANINIINDYFGVDNNFGIERDSKNYQKLVYKNQ